MKPRTRDSIISFTFEVAACDGDHRFGGGTKGKAVSPKVSILAKRGKVLRDELVREDLNITGSGTTHPRLLGRDCKHSKGRERGADASEMIQVSILDSKFDEEC